MALAGLSVLKEVTKLRADFEKKIKAKYSKLKTLERHLEAQLHDVRLALGTSDAKAPKAARTNAKGTGGKRRRGGKSQAIIDLIKGNGKPMRADEIHAKVGGTIGSVRVALSNMSTAGKLVSLKQDGDSFRKPKKGERGGCFQVA